MQHILRITGNYADEFDVMGIHEITDKQAKFLFETQGACFNVDQELYFGSNEAVNLNDLHITVDVLNPLELEIVKKALGCDSSLSYGLIDLSDVIFDAMEEEEE